MEVYREIFGFYSYKDLSIVLFTSKTPGCLAGGYIIVGAFGAKGEGLLEGFELKCYS